MNGREWAEQVREHALAMRERGHHWRVARIPFRELGRRYPELAPFGVSLGRNNWRAARAAALALGEENAADAAEEAAAWANPEISPQASARAAWDCAISAERYAADGDRDRVRDEILAFTR